MAIEETLKDFVMRLEKGTVLFCAPDDETAFDEARQYCKLGGLTPEIVKISRVVVDKDGEKMKLILVKVK